MFPSPLSASATGGAEAKLFCRESLKLCGAKECRLLFGTQWTWVKLVDETMQVALCCPFFFGEIQKDWSPVPSAKCDTHTQDNMTCRDTHHFWLYIPLLEALPHESIAWTRGTSLARGGEMNKHNWRRIRTLGRSMNLGFESTRTPEGPESYKETMEHGLVGDVPWDISTDNDLLMCAPSISVAGTCWKHGTSWIRNRWFQNFGKHLSAFALLRRPFLNFLSRFAAFACGNYNGLHRCPAIAGSSSHRSLPFGNPK